LAPPPYVCCYLRRAAALPSIAIPTFESLTVKH
jgi:hypothetical protein